MEKIQVHNLIILDESGSMESIKERVISGFNETVQTIKGSQEDYPDQEQFVSFVSFNGRGIKMPRFVESADKLKEISRGEYNPNSVTPLFDAMGLSITRLEDHLKNQNPESYRVLVTILTDGYENASREYSASAVKALVERLKAGNWTFVYVGTDHDIDSLTDRLSIDNRMYFHKTNDGLNTMYEQERRARRSYYRNVSEKSEKLNPYFDIDFDSEDKD